MLKIILTVLIIYLDRKCVLTVRSKIECGYKQCPLTRDGALNVHLIPHSHMDAGWVKTFDEYYYGTKTTISTANVQLIFHSVLTELLHDKRRKFTFSETGYFWRWWKEQRPTTRATFRSLVQEGRIEFAGGGWVQNDESTLDYLQIIDLYTWGLRKINDTLGPCGKPKASWQIDSYGHTREQTSLLAQMGFDGLFIGRVDHKEREAMIEEDRMEFMWRGSDTLGKMSDIMTHTLYNLYNAPEGFCFDFLCSDEPIVDDPDNQVYNAEKRVNDFITHIERQAKYYDHDNILVTMGGDFTYQSASNWFMNMDKLINHVNTHPGNITDVNIFYSSPSCYLKAIYLYGRRDKAIYTEKGDHLPYGSDSNTYWTGYYTSRPSLKYYVRKAHLFLQVVKQLTVIARMGDSYELHLLRHAANLVLHHDAITGTSQQHVTNDFIRLLSEAVDACTKKVSNLLSYLTPTWGGTRRSKNSQAFVVCHQLNMSQCRFTETQESMLLVVYNPLSIKTYHHIRLPAIALHYTIRDYNDEEVEYQMVPLPAAVINLPGRASTAIQELCFEVENVPPLGYAAYYISPVRDQLAESAFAKHHAQKEKNRETESTETVPNISNEYLKVTINKDTGFLESVQHVDGHKLELSQNFYFYSQVQQPQQSGAYCFRPDTNRPKPVTQKVQWSTVRGSLVKEIRQHFSDWVTQIIRLYRGEDFIEFEWVIGPVPIGNDLGKEVVTIFSTNISNNGQFFTDSNGRQMMKRTCWNETTTQQQKKPIASCYYPVTSRICLQSTNASVGMCVLTDRAQGGTSYDEGNIELMLHRRLLTDDGFGLEESLNEEAFGVGLVVKGKHRMVFGNPKIEVEDLTYNERVAAAARKWQLEPWLFMTSGDKVNRRKWQNIRNKRYSAVRLHGLPRHVHILTLEPWKAGSVLLRLENTLETGTRGRFRNAKTEGPEDYANKLSHITVQLRLLFQLRIRKVRETTLAANQWLDDARQMDWSTRYVYQGADDEILAEDNVEYKDESKSARDRQEDEKEYKEPGNLSDEEQGYNRQRQARYNRRDRKRDPKTRSKQRDRSDYDYNYRKRRSVNNGTINIQENIINGTFIDKLEKYIDKVTDKKDVDVDVLTTDAFKDSTTKIDEVESTTATIEDKTTRVDNATILVTTHHLAFAKQFKDMRNSAIAKKIAKTTFNNPKLLKPRLYQDYEKSVEVTSSEEDFSGNLRKKSPRRRKVNRTTSEREKIRESVDTSDDGVTKSMYEMYYKPPHKTKARNAKLLLRGFEEGSRKNKKRALRRMKSNDYTEGIRSLEAKLASPRDYEETNTRVDIPREYEIPEDKRKKRTKKKLRRSKTQRETEIRADMPFLTHGRRYRADKRVYEEDSGEHREFEEYKEERKGPREPSRRVDFPTRSRRQESTPPDYDLSSDVEENERDADNDDRETYPRAERRKRAPAEEPTDLPAAEQETAEEPEYIITLRPTQIRTFIIYFENNRAATS